MQHQGILRPSPLPLYSSFLCSLEKGSKIFSRYSSNIPMPLSFTARTKESFLVVPSQVIVISGMRSVYLMALPSRLLNRICSCAALPSTVGRESVLIFNGCELSSSLRSVLVHGKTGELGITRTDIIKQHYYVAFCQAGKTKRHIR
jgi:hypothetical protein